MDNSEIFLPLKEDLFHRVITEVDSVIEFFPLANRFSALECSKKNMVNLWFADQKTRETTTAATTATKKQRNRKHMVRVLKNSFGKKNEMIHGFLMVKLKPSSQKNNSPQTSGFPRWRHLNTFKKRLPFPFVLHGNPRNKFLVGSSLVFSERKTSSTFVLF